MKYLLHLIAVLIVAAAFGACRSGETAQEQTASDSLRADSAVTERDTTDSVTPPAEADGLFDDFLYNFMRNKRFQFERIKFPLANDVHGKNEPIVKPKWVFDPLYSRRETYTIIFNSLASVGSDHSHLTKAAFEWIYLQRGEVKRYNFEKIGGKWMLTSMKVYSLSAYPNDFLKFYARFSADERFQQSHVANPFAFKTYDDDSFQELDGVLDAAQWPDFRPDLPKDVITNIDYGQPNEPEDSRILVITSSDGALSCTLSFKIIRNEWRLTAMESI